MEQGKYYKKIDPSNKSSLNLKEVFKYRDLIDLLVKREFISKYKQTILGPAWAIIQPLLTTVVFTFIFGNVAGLADCGAVPTFLFYMCGNVFWQFFSTCLTDTSNTFINNANIMGKVYFPRLCVPISTTISALISFGIQFVMFIIFLVICLFIPNYSIGINGLALLLPLHIIQLALLGMGCGIIIASCTTKYRDLRFLVSFGVQLWMYASPIAYSLNIFRNKILSTIIRINPVTPIIEMIRYGFLGKEAGSVIWGYYGLSWIITIVILVIGIRLFSKVEKTFMDMV